MLLTCRRKRKMEKVGCQLQLGQTNRARPSSLFALLPPPFSFVFLLNHQSYPSRSFSTLGGRKGRRCMV